MCRFLPSRRNSVWAFRSICSRCSRPIHTSSVLTASIHRSRARLASPKRSAMKSSGGMAARCPHVAAFLDNEARAMSDASLAEPAEGSRRSCPARRPAALSVRPVHNLFRQRSGVQCALLACSCARCCWPAPVSPGADRGRPRPSRQVVSRVRRAALQRRRRHLDTGQLSGRRLRGVHRRGDRLDGRVVAQSV